MLSYTLIFVGRGHIEKRTSVHLWISAPTILLKVRGQLLNARRLQLHHTDSLLETDNCGPLEHEINSKQKTPKDAQEGENSEESHLPKDVMGDVSYSVVWDQQPIF
ncbi:hypothetical protein C5167_019925 [Papaver somniferum]|uniref:Uncharacterized protein n=1 Tax=Papaver somniferum TaxID=3469 RepID=A0A4Y7IUN9_PAPSO|nr:hypothetical protein C5167_019925 [Papaver somniferum]